MFRVWSYWKSFEFCCNLKIGSNQEIFFLFEYLNFDYQNSQKEMCLINLSITREMWFTENNQEGEVCSEPNKELVPCS